MKNVFIDIARMGKNNSWLYVAGFLIVMVAAIVFSLPTVLVTNLKTQKPTVPAYQYMAVALLQFIGIIVGLWFVMKFLHGRSFKTLITPFETINWKRIAQSAGLWFVITVVVELLFYGIFPEMYRFTLNIEDFLPALIVGVLLIPIQSTAEELLCRGYLLQGIGSKNIWVGVIVTAVLFGLAHGFNPEIQKVGFAIAMIYFIGVGLFFALLTVFDKKLELPMGIHAANNVYSFLIVSYPDSVLPSPSIFMVTELNFSIMIAGWLITTIIYVFLANKIFNLRPVIED
ncbi:type II CAAX endopeptidase family protein [Arcicella sp. LKC2W]|uniref:CPBP family intramembrane glutamic endopeptidase n=1 Tax=Arcicella sp. LKC2W TaxID=2984198 RepID=UPI002B20B31F|nr:type II CAAX endopeptidase family protein [Arcicella sp. LKC2W]MEA5461919.1 type II CAAX endopeptidase family protein [Arcicella sp. LKC2W]